MRPTRRPTGAPPIRPLLAAALLGLGLPAPAADPAPPEVEHRVLAADRSTGKVAIVNGKGEVEWEFANKHDVHDLHLLPGGNLLVQTGPTTLVEVTPGKEVVWRYESRPKEGYSGRVEAH